MYAAAGTRFQPDERVACCFEQPRAPRPRYRIRVKVSKVLMIWFTAVALASVAAIALGVSITLGTGLLLGGLCLVPAVIVYMLWPRATTLTAGDVLRGTDSRK